MLCFLSQWPHARPPHDAAAAHAKTCNPQRHASYNPHSITAALLHCTAAHTILAYCCPVLPHTPSPYCRAVLPCHRCVPWMTSHVVGACWRVYCQRRKYWLLPPTESVAPERAPSGPNLAQSCQWLPVKSMPMAITLGLHTPHSLLLNLLLSLPNLALGSAVGLRACGLSGLLLGDVGTAAPRCQGLMAVGVVLAVAGAEWTQGEGTTRVWGRVGGKSKVVAAAQRRYSYGFSCSGGTSAVHLFR